MIFFSFSLLIVLQSVHLLKSVYTIKVFDQKLWSKFSSIKFFDRVSLHQKLCQRTLMDFDGIETHTYLSKNFDGL